MKEYLFGCIMVIALLCTPLVIAGDLVSPTSTVEFGSKNFEKKETPISVSIKIKNNNESLGAIGLTPTFTAKNGFNGKVEVKDLKDIGAKQEITIKIEVTPGDFNAIDDEFRNRGFIDIGNIIIKGKIGETEVQTETISLRLQIENDLEFAKIEFLREDDSKKSISEDSSYTITEDEDIKMTFIIRNKFGGSGLNLEDIEITMVSDDLKIDEETDISEIEAGKTEEVNIKFSTDEIDKATVIVEVTGRDEEGGKHGQRFEFKFNVEKKKEEDAPPPEEDEIDDNDGDGVSDVNDLCPNTISKCFVDSDGCPLDSDKDGICNALDPTPNGDPKDKQDEQKIDTFNQLQPNRQQNQQDQQNQKKDNSPEGDEETDGLIPFLIGFAIGIGLTSGFFMLIKS